MWLLLLLLDDSSCASFVGSSFRRAPPSQGGVGCRCQHVHLLGCRRRVCSSFVGKMTEGGDEVRGGGCGDLGPVGCGVEGMRRQ
nr:unnamed protein product [Digitaria exilis]